MLLATLIRCLRARPLRWIGKALRRSSSASLADAWQADLEVCCLEERRVMNAAPVAAPTGSSATNVSVPALATPGPTGGLTIAPEPTTDLAPKTIHDLLVVHEDHGTAPADDPSADTSASGNNAATTSAGNGPGSGSGAPDAASPAANTPLAQNDQSAMPLNSLTDITLSGTQANQPVEDDATIHPFANVTLSIVAEIAQEPLLVQVTLDDPAKGQLTPSGGFYETAPGSHVYYFDGTAAEATTALRALVFAPTSHHVAPGTTETTHFPISFSDGLSPLRTDNNTSVVVTAINQAPHVQVGADQVINQGVVLNLAGVTFTDANPQDVHAAVINWGDGQSSPAGVTETNGSGTVQASHTYQVPGDYSVIVNVIDNHGEIGTAEFQVHVEDVPPDVSHIAPQVIDQGVTFNLPGVTFHDPGTQENFGALIDWGDGTQSPAVVGTTIGPSGTDGTVTANHVYSDVGVYQVVVNVADSYGQVGSQTFAITVNDVAPTIGPIAGQSVDQGATLSLSGVTFHDPGKLEHFGAIIDWGDGTQSLGTVQFTVGPNGSDGTVTATHVYALVGSYTATVNVVDNYGQIGSRAFNVQVNSSVPVVNPIEGVFSTNEGALFQLPTVTYSSSQLGNTAMIDWGDGTQSAGTVSESATPNGASGTVSGTHYYADNGSYHVTVSVTNVQNKTAAVSFELTVNNVMPNIDPVASQTTNEGTQFNLPTVTFHDPGTLDTHTATIDWGDGSPVVSGVVTETTSGPPGTAAGLTGTIAGSHVYATFGTYNVTIAVTDKDGSSSSRSVVVEVKDLPPTVDPIVAQSTNEGTQFSLPMVTFHDPGTLDTHTATIDWGDGSSVDVGSVTEANTGPPGSTAGLTGTIAGSHVYANDGTYTVTITAKDNGDLTGSRTFVVTVGNLPPTIDPVAAQSIDEGSLFSLPTVMFHDPGTLDTHTATIDWGDGSGKLPMSLTEAPFGPPGSTTGATGTTTSSHTFGKAGIYNVSLTVTDNANAATTTTIVVTVRDVAPEFTGMGSAVPVQENRLLTVADIPFRDPTFAVPGLNYVPSFSYVIDWGDGTPVQSGTATVTQPGAVGSATQAVMHGLTHNYGVGGDYTAKLTVNDNEGETATQSFGVHIINVPPVLTGFSFSELNVLSMTYGGGQSYDQGTAPITIVIHWGDGTTSGPFVVPGAQLDTIAAQHMYSGPPDPKNPAAMIPVTITATDVPGAVVSQTVLVQVPGTGVQFFYIIPLNQSGAGASPSIPLTDSSSLSTSSAPAVIASNLPLLVRAERTGAADDQIVMRVVTPEGQEGENVLLSADVLEDLPGYIRRLPDGHYRFYFVQGDTQRARLIMDVNVRAGRLVDPDDDSDGTQDRPPSASIQQGPHPLMAAEESAVAPAEGASLLGLSEEPMVGAAPILVQPSVPSSLPPVVVPANRARLSSSSAQDEQERPPAGGTGLTVAVGVPLAMAALARARVTASRQVARSLDETLENMRPGMLTKSGRLLRRVRRAFVVKD